MNKKGIIFDLDGTTINTSKDLAASVNYALKKNGFEELSVEEIIACTGNGQKKLIERVLKDQPRSVVDKVYKDFERYYLIHPYDFSEPYDGVVETLKVLKEKNYKLCLISNKDNDVVQELIEHFFPGIFDFVTGSYPGIPLKPDPTLTYLAMTKVELETDDMVFVGDTLVDYETAQNIRMTSIILTSGFSSKEKIEERGVPIMIEKFKDLLLFL